MLLVVTYRAVWHSFHLFELVVAHLLTSSHLVMAQAPALHSVLAHVVVLAAEASPASKVWAVPISRALPLISVHLPFMHLWKVIKSVRNFKPEISLITNIIYPTPLFKRFIQPNPQNLLPIYI